MEKKLKKLWYKIKFYTFITIFGALILAAVIGFIYLNTQYQRYVHGG